MKTFARLVVGFVLGALVISPVVARAAGSGEAQGQEQLVRVLMPGNVAVRDGHTLIQGAMEERRIDSSDARLAGWETLVYDTVTDATGAGYMRGAFRLVTAAGIWEGTFSGVSGSEHMCGSATGRGTQGYAGLEVVMMLEDGSVTAYLMSEQ